MAMKISVCLRFMVMLLRVKWVFKNENSTTLKVLYSFLLFCQLPLEVHTGLKNENDTELNKANS
jgi:thiosulfate reductase cytochrome b subunit